MKKLFFLLLLALFVWGEAIAQFSLRPQVGINVPRITEDIVEGDWEGKVGYQFGVDFQIGGAIYLQPGINFETNNFEIASVGDFETNRINIPVLLGFRLFEGESSAFGLRGFIGPNFAFVVSEELDSAFTSITEENVNDAQISALAGAGLDLSIVFLDVAYKFGLSDIFENSDANTNIFFINAGLRLGF